MRSVAIHSKMVAWSVLNNVEDAFTPNSAPLWCRRPWTTLESFELPAEWNFRGVKERDIPLIEWLSLSNILDIPETCLELPGSLL